MRFSPVVVNYGGFFAQIPKTDIKGDLRMTWGAEAAFAEVSKDVYKRAYACYIVFCIVAIVETGLKPVPVGL